LTDAVQTSAGRVVCAKTGSGPPLVLVHGWPWSSVSWHRIVPTLKTEFTLYWYDLPGFGQSEMVDGQQTGLDAQGLVFCEMLEYWELEKPSVLAHDIGGALTLRAHLLHGCEFEQYLLMNVVAMRPWGSEFFTHVGNHIEAFLGLPAPIHAALVRAYITGALVTELSPNDLDALIAPWLTESGQTSFYRQFAQADESFTAQIEPLFGDIRCKVGILWGEEDPWIPLSRGKAFRDLVQPERFLTMPGVGHLPQLENAALLNKHILSFF